MNAMSALYHIAQNDSPTLTIVSGLDPWSEHFKKFINLCLLKSPATRPSASELLKNDFICLLSDRKALVDLIRKTKEIVRDLDNLQYRKMKKIIMTDSNVNNSSVAPTTPASSLQTKPVTSIAAPHNETHRRNSQLNLTNDSLNNTTPTPAAAATSSHLDDHENFHDRDVEYAETAGTADEYDDYNDVDNYDDDNLDENAVYAEGESFNSSINKNGQSTNNVNANNTNKNAPIASGSTEILNKLILNATFKANQQATTTSSNSTGVKRTPTLNSIKSTTSALSTSKVPVNISSSNNNSAIHNTSSNQSSDEFYLNSSTKSSNNNLQNQSANSKSHSTDDTEIINLADSLERRVNYSSSVYLITQYLIYSFLHQKIKPDSYFI